MNLLPPLLLLFRLGRFILPIPLVLLWPLIPPVVLLGMTAAPWMGPRETTLRQRLLLPWRAYACYTALRGLDVKVQENRGTCASIAVY